MATFFALFRRHMRLVAAGAVVVAIAILAARWLMGAPEAPEPPAIGAIEPANAAPAYEGEPAAEPSAAPTAEPLLVVYVSGAVRAPDVYQLPATARIKDLVVAAGGFSADADAEQVNLAERLSDGQHIHIPRQGEAAPASAASPASAAGAAAQAGAPIDINSASAAELDGIAGIGQALAQRIIEYRAAHGPFKSVDELNNVKGIGATLLGKIAPSLTAGP